MNVRSSNLDNAYTNGEQYEEEIKEIFQHGQLVAFPRPCATCVCLPLAPRKISE